MNLADIRKEYVLRDLNEDNLLVSPFDQLSLWLKEAIEVEVNEPTAMNLSTVDSTGQPSSRIVLLKGVEDGKLKFFTNYESKKGKEMFSNPKVALTFFWPELERQIRIQGSVVKLSSEESNQYFFSRPVESQIGAVASPQSSKIENRLALEDRVAETKPIYLSKPERPSFWGGYGVLPDYFEFWQGRASRLHDRLVYELTGNTWVKSRLAP